jgi:hypothetical protein
MEKKLYISPMVTVLKLSTEVGFLAGSGTEPGAEINDREGGENGVDDPMAKPMPDYVDWGF